MKRFLSLLLCLLLLAHLAGCGAKKDMAFTAVLPRDVMTLDPQTAVRQSDKTVIGSIFEGLCRIGPDGEILPGAAKSWDHNADCTEFTFHLRSGLKWGNGTPLTAEDFLFGVVRALRPETGATSVDDLFLLKNARAIYRGEAEESTLGLTVKNDRTLIARLETGYPDFPALTAGSHYMPCSQAFFEESAGHYGLSAEYTLTNGPFSFPHDYAWNTGYNERSITLVRSDTYRGEEKTAAASLTYLIDYDDEIDEDPVASLVSGAVDVLELSEPLAKAAEEQGCRILTQNDRVTGLLLNPEADKLHYVSTRELLIKTLDRETLLGLWSGQKEALGIMPDCVPWNKKSLYADGTPRYAIQNDAVTELIPSLVDLLEVDNVPSITVLCPDDEDSIRLADGFLASWNAKLGNAYNIYPLPESELESRVLRGEYEAALYDLRAGGVSPYNVVKAFESTSSPALLQDDDYDAAFHALDFTLPSFQSLEDALRDKYVYYPLFEAKTYYALAPGVVDITVSPDHRIDFSQARKRRI